MKPAVSVIIPTRNRPVLVQRAIESVLKQTFEDLEIVVVVDGPDPATDPEVLEALDTRIAVHCLKENVGLAEARNQGILCAKGEWIALLDDDDEWLPEKLTRQVAMARQLGGSYVFVPCRFLEKTNTLERSMPLHLPVSAARFSEYMYCVGGYLQPSMFFFSRRLATEVPFTKGLRHIEDADWLLRMAAHPEVQVGAVPETLTVYYNIKSGGRESETTPWQHPLKWAVAHHDLFTRKAFPFFVARLCLNARRAGEPIGILFHLLKTARTYGDLTPKALGYFLAYWFLSGDDLRRIRSWFGKLMPTAVNAKQLSGGQAQ